MYTDARAHKKVVVGPLVCMFLLLNGQRGIAADIKSIEDRGARPTEDILIKNQLAIMQNRIKDFNTKNEIQRRKGMFKPNLLALQKLYDDIGAVAIKIAGSIPADFSSFYEQLANVYETIEMIDGQLMVYNQKTTTLKTRAKNMFKKQGKEISTTSKEDKASIKAKLIEEKQVVEDLEFNLEKLSADIGKSLTIVQGSLTKLIGNNLVFAMLFQSFLQLVGDLLTKAKADLVTAQQRINNLR